MRDRGDEVFSICIAYEQGVGKGREGRITIEDNPYCGECDEKLAWFYGYDEGNRWLNKQPKKDKQ